MKQYAYSFLRRMSYGTVSNAFLRSINTPITISFESHGSVIFSKQGYDCLLR